MEGGKGLQSVADVVEIDKCSIGHHLTDTEKLFLMEGKVENVGWGKSNTNEGKLKVHKREIWKRYENVYVYENVNNKRTKTSHEI